MITKSALPKSNVQSLAEQAHGLVAPLERGQAHKPLTDALRALMEAGDAPLVISVLCLDHATSETIVPQAKTLSSASGQIVCRIAGCDALRADMAAYQNFCRGAHVLLVAGSAGCELDQEQIEVVRSASQLLPLLWPIVIGSSDEQPAQWLQALCPSSATLAPSIMGSDQVTTVDWHERLQPFREPLFLQQRAGGLAALIEKLAARAESELAYLALAQSRLETPPKISPTRGGTDSDKELAPLRERLAEQSAAIDRQLSLKSERSTQPLGELSGMMRSICSSIAVEDLEQSRSASLLKLSINASHLAHLNRRLEHALRQEFISDLQEVQRQMRRATDELLGTLCTRFQSGMQVNLPLLDVNHAWRSVENLMAIGKETHIELARKGFFDVLTAGRQKVFIIIMFASLMGRMGLPNLFTTHASKAAFGMFMGVVMVVSMVCAIMHWRREKETTSEKELSKIRDSMLADGCKVIDQVERVKLAAMRDYLKEATRTIECTVKQSLDETLAAERAKREAELQKQETLRKSLDLRVKQATEIQRQVIKLLEPVRSLASSASRTLQELAARSLVASAGRTGSELKALAAEPTAEPIKPIAPRPSIERPARPVRTTPSTTDRPRATSALAERRQRRELAS
ncbi:MAG: hypothetical protein ACTHK7_13160 [Aureliella sp.]